MKRQARRDDTFREENHLLLHVASLFARERSLHRNVVLRGNAPVIDDRRTRSPRREERNTYNSLPHFLHTLAPRFKLGKNEHNAARGCAKRKMDVIFLGSNGTGELQRRREIL
jgi:hypothetical protein